MSRCSVDIETYSSAACCCGATGTCAASIKRTKGGKEMIVNPWLFYVMNVCSGAKVFAMVMSFLTGFIFCVLVCFFIVAMIDEAEIDKTLETVAKWTLFLFVLFTLLYILIPGEDTLLLMQAAKLATTDNVNAIFEALKNAMDYVVSVLS